MEATQPGPAADVRSKIRPQLKSVTQAYEHTVAVDLHYEEGRHYEVNVTFMF